MVGAAAAATEPLLRCGNCRQPMQRLALPGHYGTTVELDLCATCDLIWFDLTETAQLTGPAMLALIDRMAASHALPHELLRDDARCPRCDGRLAAVHNQSRWGRSSQLQCERRHGAYQTFAQFLGEKGLLRPMSRIDRAGLVQRHGRIECVNCGGAVAVGDERCPYCRSVPSLLDVARLAHALDPLDTIEPAPVMHAAARQSALQCAACGAALPAGESVRCPQCGATLAVMSLAEANAAVQALAPAIRAAAEKPSPAVVKRRLEALDADLPRRREWVAGMEREARERRGWGDAFETARPAEPFDWASLWQGRSLATRAAVVAVVALWGWLVWKHR